MHTFTHRGLCPPCKATGSGDVSWGTPGTCRHSGGAGDRTSNLPVTSQSALPPEATCRPLPPTYVILDKSVSNETKRFESDQTHATLRYLKYNKLPKTESCNRETLQKKKVISCQRRRLPHPPRLSDLLEENTAS